MKITKLLPNLLMAAGAAILLGVGFSLANVQRWSVFGAIVLAGVGFFWDKLTEGK